MSQEAFAQRGGVQKRSQINYEKGDRKPDAAYFEGIAAAGANVSYILTGQTIEQRVDALEQRMTWVKETTEKALGLTDDRSKQTLIQSVLFGALVSDKKLVDAAIEHYVIQRAAEVALSESLPKQIKKSRKKC